MTILIVSGTPGVGKSRLAKKLAKDINYVYLDLTTFIKKCSIHDGYDRKKQSYIVDTNKMISELINYFRHQKRVSGETNYVIDGHLSHYLPAKMVDLCIVLNCDLKKLNNRLTKRGYSKNKIRENLDCEIFNVCAEEAQQLNHEVKSFNDSVLYSSILSIVQKKLCIKK